ncbi:hypothetical protein FOCC_FOCC012385 [Frankliniella occidentalis]|nr:hypothetical protein FOCC_FOCC012385 [Frankliniella occidentalis]
MERMQQLDVVEPSTSLYNLPLVVVKKKAINPGDPPAYRWVIDCRRLNSVVRHDIYVDLPKISDALEALANQEYFTCLDLSNGYFNLKVHPKDRHKLAFSVKNSRFQLKRLAMGLKTSSFQFQLHINKVLSGLIGVNCLAYVDDVICFSGSFESHLSDVGEVLGRLSADNLRLNPRKCEWAQKEVKYLGFRVSKEGVTPDPQKLAPLRDITRLHSVREVKSFMGLCAFFKSHVPNLYRFTEPLIRLTRKNTPFTWGEEQQAALDYVK